MADAEDETIASGLDRALQGGGGLSLRYQPILRTSDRQMLGVEALLSWETPEGRVMDPHAFIPVAERRGLAVPLGEWVLATACAQIQALNRRHGLRLSLNINVSPLHLMQDGFVGWLTDTLHRTGLAAHCLTIEVTEGCRLEVGPAAVARLQQLRQLGIDIALDDFGTGYSGLHYLARLPVDKLKIDQSFIAGIGHGEEDVASLPRAPRPRPAPDDELRHAVGTSRIVIASMIEMAHRLSLQVVAEGVEREAQLAFLQQQGCDAVQGFLFASGLDLPRLAAFCSGVARMPAT
ncbi:EAL domain-containing protein [Cupriavidus sp. AU9028]|uniref:EAL domain-containing protein n=1 Tax=Cupriavidus sp. AU9028 TaxID=2871157 RepID=UPI001C94C4B5|nr:EAL domain-containing protein [Cupriavidus sp. AU9028]MBY4896893.1 EAL domain-containing protein [Cupriavidus sp. AU9028]